MGGRMLFFPSQDLVQTFALQFYLVLQTALLLVFLLWSYKHCSTFLNAPLIITGALYFWHFPFVVGYFLHGQGLFGYPGGVFDIGAKYTVAAIAFSGLCLNFVILGFLYAAHFRIRLLPEEPRLRVDTTQVFLRTVRKLGFWGIVFLFFILCAYYGIEGKASSETKYMDLYLQASYSPLYRLFHATQFFIPVFSLMYLANRKITLQPQAYGFVALLIFLTLLGGSRSIPFLIAFTWLICMDNFTRPLKASWLALLVLCFSAMSWIVSQARGGGLGFNIFTLPENNSSMNILHFFWEAGRTIQTVIMTMHYVAKESLRQGTTFLSNLLDLVPTASNIWRDYLVLERPSEWLVERASVLKPGHAYGYSLVAEAYFNFGSWGFLLFLFLGVFVGRFYFNYVKTRDPFSYFVSMITALLLSLHMRNDSGSYFRILLLSFFLLWGVRQITQAQALRRLTFQRNSL